MGPADVLGHFNSLTTPTDVTSQWPMTCLITRTHIRRQQGDFADPGEGFARHPKSAGNLIGYTHEKSGPTKS